MKGALGPTWSAKEREAGERFRQAWEEHFTAAEARTESSLSGGEVFGEDTRVTQAVERQGAALMRYPNVVGVGAGARTRGGRPTGDSCIVVYVARKVPRDQLGQGEILPNEVDGVPVDVVEVGTIEPLPMR